MASVKLVQSCARVRGVGRASRAHQQVCPGQSGARAPQPQQPVRLRRSQQGTWPSRRRSWPCWAPAAASAPRWWASPAGQAATRRPSSCSRTGAAPVHRSSFRPGVHEGTAAREQRGSGSTTRGLYNARDIVADRSAGVAPGASCGARRGRPRALGARWTRAVLCAGAGALAVLPEAGPGPVRVRAGAGSVRAGWRCTSTTTCVAAQRTEGHGTAHCTTAGSSKSRRCASWPSKSLPRSVRAQRPCVGGTRPLVRRTASPHAPIVRAH